MYVRMGGFYVKDRRAIFGGKVSLLLTWRHVHLFFIRPFGKAAHCLARFFFSPASVFVLFKVSDLCKLHGKHQATTQYKVDTLTFFQMPHLNEPASSSKSPTPIKDPRIDMSANHVPLRQLGKNGPKVPAIGFGLMGLSHSYGSVPEDEERFAILDRASALGNTFWDSSE